MNHYRIRKTGVVVTENDLRASMENISLPAVIDGATCDLVGVDPVLAAPAPPTTAHQSAVRNGVVQDGLGNWVWAWAVRDLSAEEIAEASKARVPREVTMRQARLALLGAGVLGGVEAALNSLPEPQRSAARIEWEYSATVQRDKALVLVLAPRLGLTDAQIDQLFIAAAQL